VLKRRRVPRDACGQKRFQYPAQVLARELRNPKMRRVCPLARDDLPHRITDRGQNDAEFRVALANHVEMAQSLQKALPHMRADFIGFQDHVEKRPALHRKRAASGSERPEMQKSELTLVAGSAFVQQRAIIRARGREPGLGYELVIVRVVGALKPDADGGFDTLLTGPSDVART
jgi:hypothetical protein